MQYYWKLMNSNWTVRSETEYIKNFRKSLRLLFVDMCLKKEYLVWWYVTIKTVLQLWLECNNFRNLVEVGLESEACRSLAGNAFSKSNAKSGAAQADGRGCQAARKYQDEFQRRVKRIATISTHLVWLVFNWISLALAGSLKSLQCAKISWAWLSELMEPIFNRLARSMASPTLNCWRTPVPSAFTER